MVTARWGCKADIANWIPHLINSHLIMLWNRCLVLEIFSHRGTLLKLGCLKVGQKAVVVMVQSANRRVSLTFSYFMSSKDTGITDV